MRNLRKEDCKNSMITGIRFLGFALTAATLASCGPTTIPVSIAPPVVTSATSNPDCDGSGVASSASSFSVGGTAGCISSVSTALEAEAATIRASSQYAEQRYTHLVDGRSYTSHSLIAGRFEYAHALNITGAEQIVAVLDDGFRTNHIEFTNKSVTYGHGRNADNITRASHGTAVAGLIGGTAEAGRTLGAAPNVGLHLMSWNDGSDADAVREAEALGAIAMNNSWGYTCSGSAFNECGVNDYGVSILGSGFLTALNNYAGDEGIVVFAASNEETQTQATLMAALPVHVPTLEEGWLAVINLARDYDASQSDLFDDSSVGQVSSGCLEAAKWCIAADGTSYIATATLTSSYTEGTGTSYAAPRVSAAIALLAEAFPNLSAKELRNRLLITADNDFFASDTANITTMNFAGGLTHDYHWVYGHGFLDMRAALLPIGYTHTTTSRGQIDLAAPTIISSSAIGNGLQQSLNAHSLRAVDATGAEFVTSAGALAAARNTDQRHALALAVFDTNRRGATLSELSDQVFTDPNFGAAVIPVALGNGWQASVTTPTNPYDQRGLSLRHQARSTHSDWSVAISATHDPASLLGMSLADAQVSSNHLALSAEYGTSLGDGLHLAADGYWAAAEASSSGVLSGFDDLRYNRIGLSLTKSDVLGSDGAIKLFAHQPTAMTGGTASAQLDIYDGNGHATLQDVDFGLTPTAREIEFGFEYSFAPMNGSDWLARVAHRTNAGNRSGAEETNVLIGFRHQF